MIYVKAFVFSPLQENTYVLYNEQKNCCIIDPGCYYPEEKEELKGFIEKSELKPSRLLNTHCHLDHIFGNKFIHDTWGLPLYIHEKEQRVLEMGPVMGEAWGFPFENYEGALYFLEEGSKVSLGEDVLEVLFTPGHSPGSIGFYNEKQGFVIGGDVLFNGSIGRTDLPGGDFKTLFNSIQTKLFVLPDDTKVYPGHGPVTTTGFEKMNNPFVKMF